jgi:hypothetical protein
LLKAINSLYGSVQKEHGRNYQSGARKVAALFSVLCIYLIVRVKLDIQLFRFIKPALLNHPKHIAYILDHDPGDVGDGVDVVLGIVRQAGAGHEVQVFEDGAEAFADAVVEFLEWGVAVDEQDGVVGGELGHGGEAARRLLIAHGNP